MGALASTLHAWELWDAAHEAYTRAQGLDRGAFEWRYLDAIVLQRLARHADAATRLREALALSPGYLPARVKLAEALLESGALEESKALFDALVDEPAAGRPPKSGSDASPLRRDSMTQRSFICSRPSRSFPELGAAHYALALSYRALGRATRRGVRWRCTCSTAHAGRRSTIRCSAAWPRSGTTRARSVQRGMKLAEQGDLEGAIAAHEAALARDPSLAQAHANLISLYGRARNWAKAEEHYRAVVAAGVNLGDTHYDYGVLLGLQDKWDLAEQAYRQALAVNPQHAQARNNLGQCSSGSRNSRKRPPSTARAVESQPGFRLARFNLGRMLIALDRPGEAVSELEKLVEPRDAEAPRYIFALGVAHLRAGRKDEGLKWVTEARALALQFGQNDLAAAIDRDLAKIK